MAQPLLVRLREKHPGARIDVLAPAWVAPVCAACPRSPKSSRRRSRHGELQLRERWRLGRTLQARGYTRPIVLPNT